jgi:hypothetical protein
MLLIKNYYLFLKSIILNINNLNYYFKSEKKEEFHFLYIIKFLTILFFFKKILQSIIKFINF